MNSERFIDNKTNINVLLLLPLLLLHNTITPNIVRITNKMQKCNLSLINRNHRSQYVVYRAKKVKQKNMLKAKAVVGTASTVPCIRWAQKKHISFNSVSVFFFSSRIQFNVPSICILITRFIHMHHSISFSIRMFSDIFHRIFCYFI